MRAAVTGGAGFVGSNLVDELVRGGAEVLVLDDLSSGSETNLHQALGTGAALLRVDVRDADAVEGAFTRFRPEVVFHLAAQIDVRRSMAEPALDARTNVIGSVNVFAAAQRNGVRRLVNTSTGGAIYGVTDTVPTPESAPALPLSAYGLSKRTAEVYGAWFRDTHGLDVVTLRYGNVYGPRQDPGGDAGVVAIFCDLALRSQRPTVFGDGLQTRDFVFVGDIVAANLAAADAPTLRHRLYNIGTGVEVSVLTLAAEIASAAGIDPDVFEPIHEPARAGEVRRSCLDVSRARAELGPAHPTPLSGGLRLTLDWLRRRTGSRAQ